MNRRPARRKECGGRLGILTGCAPDEMAEQVRADRDRAVPESALRRLQAKPGCQEDEGMQMVQAMARNGRQSCAGQRPPRRYQIETR